LEDGTRDGAPRRSARALEQVHEQRCAWAAAGRLALARWVGGYTRSDGTHVEGHYRNVNG
jgi:hypothetical protein